MSATVQTLDNSLRDRTCNLLRNAILDGHFRAGQKLVERELGEITGASRSVLREALSTLEARGLVERQSNRGFRVARVSARNISEIFELRLCLETLAAELFTERASNEEIQALGIACRELENCAAVSDIGRLRAAKERFYDILFTGCRNGEIRCALGNIFDRVIYLRTQLLMDPARRKTSLEEFRRLTDALVSRDRLAAREASIAHVESARDALLASLHSAAAEERQQSGAG
jgi:DNA-binding GntR family transcriptional regulator